MGLGVAIGATAAAIGGKLAYDHFSNKSKDKKSMGESALDYKYRHIDSFIRRKTLDSLKYTSNYYHYVNDIYQKNEFILPTDFFECYIHPNEFDAVYVTEKAKNTANMMCKTIDERIEKLEEKQNK